MPIWLASLFPGIIDIFKRLIPDKAAQDQATIELQKLANEAVAQQAQADAAKIESSSKVVVAEITNGNWMAANWRPCLMFLFMGLIFNQFFLIPILKMFGLHIDIPLLPDQGWNLLEIGLGGYVVGRSGEKIMAIHSEGKVEVAKTQLNEKVLADTLRRTVYTQGMTQAQWDAELAAHKAAEG